MIKTANETTKSNNPAITPEIGTTNLGRNHADLHRIIGMFINMLALRNQPNGNKTLRVFLAEVKQKLLQVYENEAYQYDELVGKLGLQGDLSRNALFKVALQIINYENRVTEIGTGKSDLEASLYKPKTRPGLFDLYLEAFESPDKLTMSLTYAVALFEESTIEKIADHYIEILKQVVTDPDTKLEDLTISHGLLAVQSILSREESMSFEF